MWLRKKRQMRDLNLDTSMLKLSKTRFLPWFSFAPLCAFSFPAPTVSGGVSVCLLSAS